AGRLAVEQEGAERGDAGARSDHDDRRSGILRQREAVGLLHIDLDLIAWLDGTTRSNRAAVAAAPALRRRLRGADERRRISATPPSRRGSRHRRRDPPLAPERALSRAARRR